MQVSYKPDCCNFTVTLVLFLNCLRSAHLEQRKWYSQGEKKTTKQKEYGRYGVVEENIFVKILPYFKVNFGADKKALSKSVTWNCDCDKVPNLTLYVQEYI